MVHHTGQRISIMINKQILLETSDIEVIRAELLKCHYKNTSDSVQQVNIYIYDLNEGADIYVIEYDETLNLLIGIIYPLKSRNSIKVKTYSVSNFKGHKLMYKYMENVSLLNILSNLESNEYFLLEQNIL